MTIYYTMLVDGLCCENRLISSATKDIYPLSPEEATMTSKDRAPRKADYIMDIEYGKLILML